MSGQLATATAPSATEQPTVHDARASALTGLPTGAMQLESVCTRLLMEGRDDLVIDGFCKSTPPSVMSLQALQKMLTLDLETNDPGFVLSGHSASLSARSVSAINPRAVIFNGINSNNAIVMAYTRGEQAVEIIVRDRKDGSINFYFIAYKQPCNAAESCTPAQTLTPETESGWTELSLYERKDLENTILDCNSCHMVAPAQDDRPQLIMRMQELLVPWTHWMTTVTPGGRALFDDFHAAHDEDETYAGIPGPDLTSSLPAALQAFVSVSGFATQPNQFNGITVENEVVGGNSTQPGNNDVPGVSAAWQQLYESFLSGNAIAVPYHDVKVTDSAKLTDMTAAYKAFTSGAIDSLPDIRQVLRDDRIYEIAGIGIDPKLRGAEIVTAACTQCHNSRLNQALSRARFNTDFSRFSDLKGGTLTGADRDDELARAIERVRLPASDIRRMPPQLLRDLTAAQIDEVVALFCSQMSQPTSVCASVAATGL